MGDIQRKLIINEIFGVTFQGEGKNIGKPVVFLRLGGCNLKCVWCDTPYTWDWSIYSPKDELHPMAISDVATALKKYPVKHLVISGGEPLLQGQALWELRDQLPKWYIEIETAGTREPPTVEIADAFNVSPKLEHSGNRFSKRHKPQVLRMLEASGRATFKFVASRPEDLDEIDAVVRHVRIVPSHVYIMPLGITAHDIEEHSKALVESVLERRYNMTTRLHVTLFGNKRGI